MEQVRDIPHHAMGDPWRYGYPDHSMPEPMSTSDEYGEVGAIWVFFVVNCSRIKVFVIYLRRL